MSKWFGLISRFQNSTSLCGLFTRVRSLVMILIIVWSLVGFSPTHVLAAGTTYYVDRMAACSDSWPGTITQPFCTIDRGAAVARNPGDTVNVLHGTYAETIF